MKKLTRIERKQRGRKILLSIIIFITLLSLMFVIMFKSDIFKIKNINVTGNVKLDEKEVINISNISIGENIFRLKIRSIEKQIRKLSYIKDVKVKRNLPNTMIINIEEREETMAIKSISSYRIIDNEGYILNITDNINRNIPVVLGLNIPDLNINDYLFDTISNKNIIELLKESKELGILDKMETIDLKPKNNISILLKDDIKIAFGRLNNVKYRLGLLNEIIKDIEKRELEVKEIIMNKGEHPVVVTKEQEER